MLGIASFLPLIYVVFILPAFFLTAAETIDQFDPSQIIDNTLSPVVGAFIAITFFMVIVIYGIMFFYILHAIMHKQLNTQSKMLWCIGVFLGNIVAYPFYWYKVVKHEGEPPPIGRAAHNWIGIGTVFPLVWFVAMIIWGVITGFRSGEPSEQVMIIWAGVFDVVFFPLWIYLMIHAVRNKVLSTGGKVGWLLLVLFLGLFTMPFYWFMQAGKTRVREAEIVSPEVLDA